MFSIPTPGIIATAYGSGAPAPVLANRWRVRWLGAPRGPARIAALEMAATPSGANLCTGGTPIANSGTASNAFDGNAATYWNSTVLAPFPYLGDYVGYVFASPVTPVEVRLTASTSVEGEPRLAVLDYSLDSGSTWVPYSLLWRISAWTSSLTVTYSVGPTAFVDDISAAFGWRCKIDSVPSGIFVGCREIEFATTGSGSTVLTDGVPFTAGTYSTNTSYMLVDGNLSVDFYCYNDAGVAVLYLGYWRPAPWLPVEFRFAPAGSSDERPSAFRIQWCSDTVNWHDYATFSGLTTGWTTGVLRTFSL